MESRTDFCLKGAVVDCASLGSHSRGRGSCRSYCVAAEPYGVVGYSIDQDPNGCYADNDDSTMEEAVRYYDP